MREDEREKTRPNYVVLESTPGYLPEDDEPATFDSYAEAVNYVARYYQELQEQDYVVSPIINGQFIYYVDGNDDALGRVVAIEPLEG